jgi:hypothetical protein
MFIAPKGASTKGSRIAGCEFRVAGFGANRVLTQSSSDSQSIERSRGGANFVSFRGRAAGAMDNRGVDGFGGLRFRPRRNLEM